MVFTPAELHELPSVISAPRFATYLQATGNDRARALGLYKWNLDLSAATSSHNNELRYLDICKELIYKVSM